MTQLAVERELARFGLDNVGDPTSPVELPLPEGFSTTSEFFQEAAEGILAPYRDAFIALNNWERTEEYEGIPCSTPVGQWARYEPRRRNWVVVDVPPGSGAYCLDFETVEIEEGKAWLPTTCTALQVHSDGSTTLYVWRQDFYNPVSLTPFSGGNLITGWNVAAYDRMYLQSEYALQPSGNVFLDLMACHIKNRGICNQQIALLTIAEGFRESGTPDGEYIPSWTYDTSSNGLAAAYKLYTGGTVDKGVRDQIVDLGLPWVSEHMPEVIKYCISDVLSTLELWGYIYPEYSGYPNLTTVANSRNPSLVSLAGHLVASTSFCTLSPDRWENYYSNAETLYQQKLEVINSDLIRRAKVLVDLFRPALCELYKAYDMIQGYKRCKPTTKKGIERAKWLRGHGYEGWTIEQLLGYFSEHLDPWSAQLDWHPIKAEVDGVTRPAWYHYARLDGITINKRIAPLLLKMEYLGKPLSYSDAKGWHTEDAQVPHPEDADKVNTALFAKGMNTMLALGELTSATQDLEETLKVVTSIAIWKSMRKRVKLMKVETVDGVPFFIPDSIPHGTMSGRQASKTLHVFPHPKPADPKKGKPSAVGSGFMSLIEALPGYSLLRIDFDSQELKLFALAGCEVFGFVGSTPLSLMVEIGQPQNKTDFHSVVMEKTGITNRTLVKNVNYAGCYNAGRATQVKTILKGNPELGVEKAEDIERLWRTTFVGDKVGKGQYVGGSASDSYNVLMRRANAKRLYTLFGGCELSKAVSGNQDFLTTRFNAVIQGTGAVMLDHILVGTTYLARTYNVNTRYMFSRHDEWCYHTADEHTHKMAWLMQVVHLATWAQLVQEMGLDSLSLNMAYASSVEVSKNYMKSIDAVTVTEDMPYQVPAGIALTKEDILAAIMDKDV
jgi:DNA polymerase gamma 1